jgi:hypothetical protein
MAALFPGGHYGDNALLDGFSASEYPFPYGKQGHSALTIVFFGEAVPDLSCAGVLAGKNRITGSKPGNARVVTHTHFGKPAARPPYF